MQIKYSDRVNKLPPYLFAEMERLMIEKKKQGVDIISFGIGDPDIPTPKFILKELALQAKDPKNHNYSLSQGEMEFRQAVANWYKLRFNVDLNPEKEIINVIGSKEGLANLARAFVNPNDHVLVPDPAYPVYAQGATTLCDGVPIVMPLLEENNFLPDFSKLPEEAKKAKLMYLNYPNNPIGAVATDEFLKQAVAFAEENSIILCYDNAYSEFSFDDYKAPSILQYSRNCIELHSCSKTFCMTGDRLGFGVGNPEIIEGLRKIKSQIDSGAPVYIQKAAIKALQSYTSAEKPKDVAKIMRQYARRRNLIVSGLKKLGLKCTKPKATFYLWVKINGSSIDFAKKLLDIGVVITPGVGFGKFGEGYIRFALTQPVERIREALERMSKII